MSEERDVELAELLNEVRLIEASSRHLVKLLLSGNYHSVFRGTGIEFDEVREYVPGDDPRSVDWNVTARVGRPYVKKYVDERELTVFFLLDQSASMAAGFGGWSLRQVAARLCACLAFTAVQNDDRVGLVAFSREVDEFVPAAKGRSHVLRIVRDCLAHPGSREASHLGEALRFARGVLTRHAIVFVVSDFMTEGYETALARCARRHDVVAVRLLPPELELPRAGLARFRDPESDREMIVDLSDARWRRDYASRVDRWRRETEQRFRRAGVDRMDVPVSRERDLGCVTRPILDFFRQRQLRGASG